MSPNTTSVVLLKSISKRFQGVVALNRVDFEINPREIIGLVGENGAGKSTLMKVHIGINQPDEGEFLLNGKPVHFRSPQEAIRSGIGMVFQEGCMIHNLSILDNVFLGHEDSFRRMGLLDKGRMRDECVKILARVKLHLDPDLLISQLSSANKQMVEIARLLWLLKFYGAENPIMILDEPTTVLQEKEVATLFETLHQIKNEASIILISHRLEEVIENTDRIVVFKDGKYVTQMPSAEADIHKIEELMVGRGMMGNHYVEDQQREPAARERLSLKNVSLEGAFEPMSMNLREGEILSLVGLIGSGKEELCQCLLGTKRFSTGTVTVEGKEVKIASPSDALENGIGHIPIDRRRDGLAWEFSVKDNINMLVLDRLKKGPLISPKQEKDNADHWVKDCLIKTSSINAPTGYLSGGNQQKVVIAKWLNSGVNILVMDHPTRGIDVGAKEEIYKRIRMLADAGMSLILMCDTLEEDIGLGNRVIIMKDGKVTREVECPKEAKPTPQDLITAIV